MWPIGCPETSATWLLYATYQQRRAHLPSFLPCEGLKTSRIAQLPFSCSITARTTGHATSFPEHRTVTLHIPPRRIRIFLLRCGTSLGAPLSYTFSVIEFQHPKTILSFFFFQKPRQNCLSYNWSYLCTGTNGSNEFIITLLSDLLLYTISISSDANTKKLSGYNLKHERGRSIGNF